MNEVLVRAAILIRVLTGDDSDGGRRSRRSARGLGVPVHRHVGGQRPRQPLIEPRA